MNLDIFQIKFPSSYTVRFEDMTSDRTKIQYMTDGTLFRQALNDRLLTKYSVIVLDEAHERTINTDVLFGLVKAAQAARKQKGLPLLRIIMMSATMDADHFANYFNGCNVIYLEGRLFPVKVWHMKESTRNMDYEEICLHTLFNIHMTEPLSEDVLVFLTGQDEVENMAASIKTILQVSLSTQSHLWTHLICFLSSVRPIQGPRDESVASLRAITTEQATGSAKVDGEARPQGDPVHEHRRDVDNDSGN